VRNSLSCRNARASCADRWVTAPVNIAKIANGFGFSAVKVRQLSDLANVREWLDGPRDEPLLIDAKVTSERGSWWLEEALHGD
jgi:acetolactate synthase I/II/III large subunit